MLKKKYIILFILISIIGFFLNYFIIYNYHNNGGNIVKLLTIKSDVYLEDYINSLTDGKSNDSVDIIKNKVDILRIKDYKKIKNYLRLLIISNNQNSSLIIGLLENRTNFGIIYNTGSLEYIINEKLLKNEKIQKGELENKKISNLGNLYLVIREIIKTNKIDLIYNGLDDIINYKDYVVQEDPEFDSLKYALESIKYETSGKLIDKTTRIKRFTKHFYLVFLSDIYWFNTKCTNIDCKEHVSELKKQGEVWFKSMEEFDENKITRYIKEGAKILNEKKYNNLYPVLNVGFIMSSIYRFDGDYNNALNLLDNMETRNIIDEKGNKIDLGYYYFYFHKGITLFEKGDTKQGLELLKKQRQYYILYSYLEMYEKSLILINKGIKDKTILWGNYNLK